jgi:hypothetical protein
VLTGEPPNDYPCWWYGVSFQRGSCAGTESEISINSEPLFCVTPECSDQDTIIISSCADYSTRNNCEPLTRYDTTSKDTNGFIKTPLPGVDVYLADSANNMVKDAYGTDQDGNYYLMACSDGSPINIDPTKKYRVIIKVPAADKAGVPCSQGFAGDDCNIIVRETPLLKGRTFTNTVGLPALPPVNGGRAEVGNPNCDTKIDIRDFLILKNSFNAASPSDPKYKSYADFNGDGKVNIKDFLILKQNFNKILDAAPTTDPSLCKTGQ